MWHCLRHPVFSRFSRTLSCDGQTQTQGLGIYHAEHSSRDKNCYKIEVALCNNESKISTSIRFSLVNRFKSIFPITSLQPHFRACPCWPVRLEYWNNFSSSPSSRQLESNRDDTDEYSSIFTARRYASAVLAVVVCLSVCPSVCPSQVGVLLKWLNIGTRKQHHAIAQGL